MGSMFKGKTNSSAGAGAVSPSIADSMGHNDVGNNGNSSTIPIWSGTGSLAGGIVSGLGTAIGQGLQYQATKETNEANKQIAAENLAYQKEANENNIALSREQYERNMAFAQEQYAYQKQLNQLQMDREDTAYSRAIKDLQANGINKLLALGNSASTGNYSAGNYGADGNLAVYEALHNSYQHQSPLGAINVAAIMDSALNWAQEIKNIQQTQKQNELIEEEILNQGYQRNVMDADTLLKKVQAAKTNEEKFKVIKETLLTNIQYLQELNDYKINRRYGVRSNDNFKEEFNTIKAMLNQINSGINKNSSGDFLQDILDAISKWGEAPTNGGWGTYKGDKTFDNYSMP